MSTSTTTTNTTTPELAVAYVRVARNPGCDWTTPQRDRCQQAANQLRVQLDSYYIDIGSGMTARRPGLDRLLARLQEAPTVQYVLVAGLDRLARGTRTFLDISEALIENGVSLVDARDLSVIDPRSFRIHAAVARHLTDLTRRPSRNAVADGDGG